MLMPQPGCRVRVSRRVQAVYTVMKRALLLLLIIIDVLRREDETRALERRIRGRDPFAYDGMALVNPMVLTGSGGINIRFDEGRH